MGATEPMKVLNGHIFALDGLYDYFMLTGDERSEELFDAGRTNVRQYIEQFRIEGEYSWYCIRADYCELQPGFQSRGYHGTHTRQLAMLARITGDDYFQEMSELFEQDGQTFEASRPERMPTSVATS